PQDAAEPENLRTMRVLRGFARRMVLAVNGSPFLCHHAGRQPQPQSKEMAHDRMQLEHAMRLMPVQEHGDRDNGDVSQDECRDGVTPPRKVVEYAGKNPSAVPPHRPLPC